MAWDEIPASSENRKMKPRGQRPPASRFFRLSAFAHGLATVTRTVVPIGNAAFHSVGNSSDLMMLR